MCENREFAHVSSAEVRCARFEVNAFAFVNADCYCLKILVFKSGSNVV